jgi:hypothetical protein
MFITEDTKVKHTNITTKLKWIVFTKVIKTPSKEAKNLIKSERKRKRFIRE